MTISTTKKDVEYVVNDSFNKSNPFLFKFYETPYYDFVKKLADDNKLEEHPLLLAYQIMLSGVIFSFAYKKELSKKEEVARAYVKGYLGYLKEIFKNDLFLVDFVIDNTPDMFSAINGPAKVMTLVYKDLSKSESDNVNVFNLESQASIWYYLSELIKTECMIQKDIVEKLKKYTFQ
ncbi:MAG: hypothetical protein NTV39_03670 [Candidatus Saccharibacteria bacterium]|nr:hypothetical protein [Candidatus Saccharibacteria bacterium]